MKELSTEDPTAEEIGELTGFDPALVEDLLSISRELVSLDAPMLGDGSSLSSIGDFIEDDSVSPEDSLIDVALQEDVGKILRAR